MPIRGRPASLRTIALGSSTASFRIVATPSGPFAVSAKPPSILTLPSQPYACAVLATICLIAVQTVSKISGLRSRIVPPSSAESGMTLVASPAWNTAASRQSVDTQTAASEKEDRQSRARLTWWERLEVGR